ncbi:T9SS type A sorting domain-containing protein [Bizionia arctica]|uniref:T9SS C-terminal target domain-containing protein n=1 Tax=Bizionia arctica TaxID=1495645 RepID=A0A917LM72_9FLAO|nr:T9SS type A sorting domain-containing protein [Bizionia arctica]GGG43956.1 T9SS C-terminal target domain-containing protein [Bizionia arctica]
MRLKFYLCNIFAFSSFICCYSQIVNEGILQIDSATNVYFENEYTNTVSGIHSSDGNLYLNHNFINDGSTMALSGTTKFKSATNPLSSISGATKAINFYNLEIDITAPNTKGLSVADNFELNVKNAIHLAHGTLRLIGKAQLIQSHTGLDANTSTSGNMLIDQYGYASAYKFNYWSSPVNNSGTFSLSGGQFDGTDSSINPFEPQQVLFNSGSPYNGIPSVLDGGNNVTTALTINTQWLYRYGQGTGSYADWISINASTVLNPGEGFTMKGTNTLLTDQNYVFSGAPNDGDYFSPIVAGEQSLLGNPYPSALDATEFITDNLTLLEAVYFWVDGGSTSHALSDYLGGYAIRNLTGGTPPSIASPLISGVGTSGSVTDPSQYIPVGQGFFVEAIGSGDITFKNSQRVFNVNTTEDTIIPIESEEYEESAVAGEPTFVMENQYLRIGYEDPEGFHRQLLLGFLPNSNADLDYNVGYDAILTEHRDDDLFFVIENDSEKKYAIQGLSSYSNVLELPLGILISESGTHKIMLDGIENFQDTVYLKDHVLNITHNLSESSFDVNLALGEHLDRYSIVFSPATTLSTTNETVSNIDVFYDGHGQIVVNNIERTQIKNIKIFNVLGQEVLKLNTNLNSVNKLQIPFNNSHGIYFVNVETINSNFTKKILNY